MKDFDVWISPCDIRILAKCRAWLADRLRESSGQERRIRLKGCLRRARALVRSWCLRGTNALSSHILARVSEGQAALLLQLGACRDDFGKPLRCVNGKLVCALSRREEEIRRREERTRMDGAFIKYSRCLLECERGDMQGARIRRLSEELRKVFKSLNDLKADWGAGNVLIMSRSHLDVLADTKIRGVFETIVDIFHAVSKVYEELNEVSSQISGTSDYTEELRQVDVQRDVEATIAFFEDVTVTLIYIITMHSMPSNGSGGDQEPRGIPFLLEFQIEIIKTCEQMTKYAAQVGVEVKRRFLDAVRLQLIMQNLHTASQRVVPNTRENLTTYISGVEKNFEMLNKVLSGRA